MISFFLTRRILALVICGWCGVSHAQEATATKAERIKPISITSVRITDSFWAPRLEVVRTVAIPAALAKCEETGRIDNFVRAAAVLRGDANVDKKLPANPFDDADVFKLVEAASHTLGWHPDTKLDAQLDAIIAKIAAAQELDGYLYTARTINPESPHALAGGERWVNEKADSFELSNLANLYQAAAAHFEATEKRSLLEVAIRSADLLDKTFGPGKRSMWPGHAGVEMGLVRLADVTGEKRYVELAAFFLNERGPSADLAAQVGQGARRGRGRGNANQSHQRVTEQIAAIGNAVDAANLYSGMAGAAARLNSAPLREAVDKIWADVAAHKLYVTGGIGATTNDGAFGRNYLLPNMSAASTTAASAANIEWNQQMFELFGDAKYVDQLERTLYNALLAGISLDGKQYFDANVLESLGRQQRREWTSTGGRRGNAGVNQITVASSPIEALAIISALPKYIYAIRGDEIFVNLFVKNTAAIELPNGATVKVVQETNYPWDGSVKISVMPELAAKFSMRLRRPGWLIRQPEEIDLYMHPEGRARGPSVLFLDVDDAIVVKDEHGYTRYETGWRSGSAMDVRIPMRVLRTHANGQVAEDAARVALQYGPLVYCLEAAGNEPAKVRSLVLPDNSQLTSQWNADVLDGVRTITGQAQALSLDKEDKLNRTPQPFTAIPYFAWANRGPGEMLVWIPNVDSQAVPIAEPNLASKARITASPKLAGQAMNGNAAKDGIESRSSHDNSPLSHFDWWPDRSVTVTCDYTWDQAITIKQTQAYWWDDSTTGGGCKVPASWRALYKKGDEWVPVETQDEYGVAPDKYNKVNFTPVETTALRLEIKIRDDASVGIQEWKVW